MPKKRLKSKFTLCSLDWCLLLKKEKLSFHSWLLTFHLPTWHTLVPECTSRLSFRSTAMNFEINDQAQQQKPTLEVLSIFSQHRTQWQLYSTLCYQLSRKYEFHLSLALCVIAWSSKRITVQHLICYFLKNR